MASLDSKIYIETELRPCIVDGRKALFHKWDKERNLLNQEDIVALVEYEDGQVDTVTRNRIKFVDNKIKEFCFESEE